MVPEKNKLNGNGQVGQSKLRGSRILTVYFVEAYKYRTGKGKTMFPDYSYNWIN